MFTFKWLHPCGSRNFLNLVEVFGTLKWVSWERFCCFNYRGLNCGGGLCYAVTTVIMQKNGAGMIMASSCFWDKLADGKLLPILQPWYPIVDDFEISERRLHKRTSVAGSNTIRWENKTMYVLVTIFGASL